MRGGSVGCQASYQQSRMQSSDGFVAGSSSITAEAEEDDEEEEEEAENRGCQRSEFSHVQRAFVLTGDGPQREGIEVCRRGQSLGCNAEELKKQLSSR